jgi:hypothetical protein
MKSFILAAIALGSAGCGSDPAPVAPAGTLVWHPIASWSGHGSMQTETFDIESGEFRVHWETSGENPPGAGMFQVTANSGDSGNVVGIAADHRGVGRDTSYVSDRPRRYYLAIESKNVDWKVTVEEGAFTTRGSPASGASGPD